MGALGSGNWYRWNCKTKTEEVKRIDIRYLKKQGWLQPGITGTLSWVCDGEPAGWIRFSTEEHKLKLDYRYKESDGEWIPVSESVWFETTACHYGGERKWFLCPHCGRRVAVLYGVSIRFLCRHCYDLAYSCQNEDSISRMYRKARKVRQRLNASSDLGEPVWEKPKGMHWKTYERLLREEEEASYKADLMLVQKFGGIF